MGDTTRRRSRRLVRRARLDRSVRYLGPVHTLAVLGVDRRSRACCTGRGQRRSRRLRRHGERAHRADGHRDVLCPLHADLLPRLGVQGGARSPHRSVHVLVHAHARRGGGRRPEPGRDAGRGLPGARGSALCHLPRPRDPSTPAGGGRRARRRCWEARAPRGARRGGQRRRAGGRSRSVHPTRRAGSRRQDGARGRHSGDRLPRARKVGARQRQPRGAAPPGRRFRLRRGRADRAVRA